MAEQSSSTGEKLVLKDAATGKFLPGSRGGGRPVGSVSPRTELRKALAKHPKRAKKIIEDLITRAEQGDQRAIEMIFDQLDGKPTQPLEVSGGLLLDRDPQRPPNGAGPPSTAERLRAALAAPSNGGGTEPGHDA